MGTVAKSSITLVSISDAYSLSLTPNSCVIKADFDGSNPKLEHAYTIISAYCGDEKTPIEIDSSTIVKSNDNIEYQLIKVDSYRYRLSIISLPIDILQGYIEIPVLSGVSAGLTGRFTFSIVRESTMLDWIQDWESNKTTIGSSYVITPKLFVGKKIIGSYDSLEDVPGLTGVYIGPSENNGAGIYGYKDNKEIFHIDQTGGKIGGWDITSGGIQCEDGTLSIKSEGTISAQSEGIIHWLLNKDGSASFANGNVKEYGGVAMYYISNADYGLIGYKNNEKVFSAGSKNFIAGWQFDKSAIWLGTKNNNVGQYTSTSGSITIGTNGFRGYSWFINADGSASFANGNFFWDTKGNVTLNGKIIATSGTIGDIEIYEDHIGTTSTPNSSGSGQWAGLSIYKDFFKVGGSKGYVMFGNDVIPASTGGAFTAVGRIVNQAPNTSGGYGYDQANYGLFIEVTGGTKNYGISSNAALKAPSFINTKAALLTFDSGNYTIDFSQFNVILMYFNDPNYDVVEVTLPNESSVARQFGVNNLPTDFATVITFRVRSYSKDIILKNIYDHNENMIDYRMVKGDSIIVLISKIDGFRYQILNHSH